jgi:hypothetical protein
MNRAALHEAGHALVALAVGVEVVSVDLESCHTRSPSAWQLWEAGRRRHIRISAAGPAAEGLTLDRHCTSRDDLRQAREHVAALGKRAAAKIIAHEFAVVAEYLAKHRTQLGRIAAAIEERGRLDADQLRAVAGRVVALRDDAQPAARAQRDSLAGARAVIAARISERGK